MIIRVGGILIGEGIEHWKLAQEFLDNEKKDSLGTPLEKRTVRHRDSHLELYIDNFEVELKL